MLLLAYLIILSLFIYFQRQAPNLWSSLETENDILKVANLWLLTLEKLGCHRLLKAGASGVIQGMVLSFGALKFSNHHLEFNTEPKDLHREYHFRYFNTSHLTFQLTKPLKHCTKNNNMLLLCFAGAFGMVTRPMSTSVFQLVRTTRQF